MSGTGYFPTNYPTNTHPKPDKGTSLFVCFLGWQQYTGGCAVLEGGGRTFREIAQERSVVA
jgi:hypothetical protein